MEIDLTRIRLKPMTAEMFHSYFKEYEKDPDLLAEGQRFLPYEYSEERVEKYIQRQKDLNRRVLAILYADTLKKNTRSRHVLEKVGFVLIGEDESYYYYRIQR